MTRLFHRAMMAFATLALIAPFASCSDSDDPAEEPETVKAEVTIPDQYQNLTFEAAASQQTITITTNAQLTLTSSTSWVTVTEAEATSSTELNYVVACTENTGDTRKATISVKADGFAGSIFVTQNVKAVTPMDGDPAEIAAALGMGWNLGNQLDSWNNEVANETCWGNKAATQATFDAIKAAGFKTVRIPVTWLGKVGGSPDYTIDSDWLNRVYEVVGYAETAGLKAIINIHHDGANSEHWLSIKSAASNTAQNTIIKNKLAAMWKQIATKFSAKGDFLVFETMNEIHDGGWGWGSNLKDGGTQYDIVNEWQQVCVDAIRATGGNNATRWIGVQGYCCNPNLTVKNLVLPSDAANRLLVSVHFYDPTVYTLEDKYNSWGHLYDDSKGDTKNVDGDESNVKSVFKSLKEKYIDNGIPVYLGEIGCVHRSTDRAEKFRKYYLEYVCKAAKEYTLAPIYWDNGATGSGAEKSGLFSHSTGVAIDNGADIAAIMVNAIENTDASYTLESVYNKTLEDY